MGLWGLWQILEAGSDQNCPLCFSVGVGELLSDLPAFDLPLARSKSAEDSVQLCDWLLKPDAEV